MHLKKNIIFMSTPFDEESMYFLNDLKIQLFKVGSTDTNNIPYLIKMAKIEIQGCNTVSNYYKGITFV